MGVGKGEKDLGRRNLLLLWPYGVNPMGKFCGLLIVWQLTLHPNHVRIRSIRNRSIDRTSASSLVAIKALSCSSRVPVPVDVYPYKAMGNHPRLGITLASSRGKIFMDEALFVDVDAVVDGVNHSVVKEFEAGLCNPFILDCL